VGWFLWDPNNLPDEPLGNATVSGWYGTLTHEPELPMVPEVGSAGPQGPQGEMGSQGPPTTALFIIASLAPPTDYAPGTAWWDLDNGRTYILYDDGSSRQWVEFIGAPSQDISLGPQGPQGFAGVQGPAGAQGPAGVQGSQGSTGGAGAQGSAGVQGPQGATGAGAQGPQGSAGVQGPAGPTNLPQTTVTGNITTTLAQAGGHFYHPASDATARTVTIDSNAVVPYVIGTTLTFANRSAGVLSIAINSDTLVLSPAGTTGTRALAQNGTATAVKTGATEWMIAGSGLT
jgi:hypothetical protein